MSRPRKSPAPIAAITPHEEAEQRALIVWAAYSCAAHPELCMLYHIPNEGKRSLATGARLQAMGLRKGVPDICLPVPRGKYHGLYIELKRAARSLSHVSPEQRAWLDALSSKGYCALVCYGAHEAERAILAYLEGGDPIATETAE